MFIKEKYIYKQNVQNCILFHFEDTEKTSLLFRLNNVIKVSLVIKVYKNICISG